jgi:hypothetical protein
MTKTSTLFEPAATLFDLPPAPKAVPARSTTAEAPPATCADAPPPPPSPAPPAPPAPKPSGALPPRPRGTPLALHIERELRRRNIPYVSVDEAKKALFASSRLKTFHFCVYAPEGSNWLLLCDEAGEANRADMAEWQNIFGDGFKSVFAVERKAGIVFKTLSDERVTLQDLAP